MDRANHSQEILEKEVEETNYLRKLGKSLNHMRKSDFLTDVALVCEDTHFFAHKSILAASSSYFAEIFQAEASRESIDLGIDADILDILLAYVYTGALYIPDNIKVENVLACASFLRLDGVVHWCSKLMLKRINSGNIFEFLKIAEKFDNSDMKQAILNHVPNNFKQIFESDTISKLPLEYVTKIIKLPNLKCTEDEKFDAILKWVHYDETKRVDQTEAIVVDLIDVKQLSSGFLAKLTDEALILKNIGLTQTILKEMSRRMKSLNSCENKNEAAPVSQRNNYVPKNTKGSNIQCKNTSFSSSKVATNVPLRSSGNEVSINASNENIKINSSDQLNSFIGNKIHTTNNTAVSFKNRNIKPNSCDLSGNTMAAFRVENGNYILFRQALNNDSQNSTEGSIQLPEQADKIWFPWDASVCVYGDVVFFIGGRTEHSWRKLSRTFAFDISNNSWQEKAEMRVARSDSGCAVFDDEIYVVGGIDQSNIRQRLVERYDPSRNSWFTVASMNMAREKPSLCSLNERLYVIGGYSVFPDQFKMRDIKSDQYATGEVYDPYTDQWTMIDTRLPVGRLTKEKEYRITSLAGRLFAVSSYAPPNGPENLHYFYEYFPISNTWKTVKCEISLKSIAFIGPYDGCICIVDVEGNVLVYSPHESKIINFKKLNIGRASLQYVTCVKL